MKQREKLCSWMFEVTKKPYAFIFKKNKTAWKLTSSQLLTFPEGSLGKKLGEFLKTNKFELIDKLESHDVYHVITGMKTSVKDEVGMQFLLFGNGKRSLYQFSTMGICLLLLPEYLAYYVQCYKKGKRYKRIHDLDLYKSLSHQLSRLRWQLRKSKSSRIKVYNHIHDFI